MDITQFSQPKLYLEATAFRPTQAGGTTSTGPANNPFLDQWQACSGHRLIRDFGSQLLDTHVPAPQFASPAVDKLVELTKPWVKNAKDYGDLLKWQDYEVEIGPQAKFRSTAEVLTSKAGWKKLSDAAYLNLKTTGLTPMSAGQIAKEIVIGDNIRTITEPLTEGKFFTGLFRAGWLGLGAIPVWKRTQERYHATHSLMDSTKTLFKEATKALTAWEIGSVGAILGGLLLPAGWAGTLAKGLMMGLFSTSAHQKLDKWVP